MYKKQCKQCVYGSGQETNPKDIMDWKAGLPFN